MYTVKVRDHEEHQVHTLTVREIADSALGFSYIRVSGFVWKDSVLANPAEERAKSFVKGAKAIHLNLHHEVLRVVELDENEALELSPNRLKLIPMPSTTESE